jgi:hypothetical protein
MTNGGTTQLPTSRSRRLRLYATIAKVASYVAPALATVLLFFAKADPVWFAWAAGALIVSISLQIGKDWWEKILSARKGPDARALDLALAQQALTSVGQMSAAASRQATLSMCRRHLVRALAREYDEWEGSVATLHLIHETTSPGKISVAIGKLTAPPPQLVEAMKSSSHAMLSATGQARSFISAPVSMLGSTSGILTLQTSETHTLSSKDVEIVEKYATMLALTFEVERSSNNGRF